MKENNMVLRLVREAGPIAGWLALGAVLDILAVSCSVAAPEVLGDLVDRLYDFTGMDALVPGTLALAGLYLGYGIFSYCNMHLMNTVVTRHFTQGLRVKLSDKLRRLTVGYVDQTPVGDILSRMIDDVGEVGGYVHVIFDVMVKGFFQILLIVWAMFQESWILACFVLALTPLSLWLSTKLAGFSEKHYDSLFETTGKLTQIVEEAFSNYPTTKAYNLEDLMGQRHGQVNRELCQVTARANFLGSLVQPVIRLINSLAHILICLAGGWLIVTQGLRVGTVVAILLYAQQVSVPLEQIAGGIASLKRVQASAKRVYDILDMEEEDPGQVRPLGPVQGHVELENICFSYDPKEPLIENLSLSVRPGQKVAIVGPTGAGKTTLVNLLMRFYDPQSGAMRLDGQDMLAMSRQQVRNCFGMVLQDTWLFRGTIRENLTYGNPDITEEELREACRRTHCDHFIRTMPQGYDTVIGEDTANLSGGQRQLLTITRAMLAGSPLLILDEATSNVDTRTEVLIQKAMDALMEGKTCFVIAHRLSTIVDSDLILVMDHGKIVEQGTHRELLDRRGFYYRLYTSQYAA